MGSRGILIVVIGGGLAATAGCGARTELDADGPDADRDAAHETGADARPGSHDSGAEAAVDAGSPTAMALGGGFACVLRSGGTVECWGNNYDGELGNGTSKGPQSCDYIPYACSTTPVGVSGLSGVTAIAAGNADGCALLSSGMVECWGDNTFGELGDGTSNGPESCSFGNPCSTTPVAVSGLSGVTALAVGADAPGPSGFACALLSSGTVECWGINWDGELGEGTLLGPETCNNLPCSTTPVAVSGLSGVTGIAAGERFACALLSGGTVDCWGSSFYGQLGNGTSTGSTTPVAVSGLSGATAISAMGDFACALLPGGTVECWGDNEWGQLGDGTSTGPQTCGPPSGSRSCSMTPVAVSGLSGVTAIAAGGAHACALLSGGTVDCWGANFFGQLGSGTSSGPETCNGMACSTTPVAVPGLSGVRAIAAGGSESCALLTGGTIECWGDNTFGELGIGTSTGPQKCMYGNMPSPCSPTPVKVSGL